MNKLIRTAGLLALLLAPGPETGAQAGSHTPEAGPKYAAGLRATLRANGNLLQFIRSRLYAEGLPAQLSSLAVIESGLDPLRVSPAGAAGLWQLMPVTARQFGLQTYGPDERFDIRKSTEAAIRLLRKLHGRYQDWKLVVAAYNCGAGAVDEAMAHAGDRGFERIRTYLPVETQRHVSRFMEMAVLCASAPADRPAAASPAPEAGPPTEVSSCLLPGGYDLSVIASSLELDTACVAGLNPGFEAEGREGNQILHLPPAAMQLFLLRKSAILRASMAQQTEYPRSTPK